MKLTPRSLRCLLFVFSLAVSLAHAVDPQTTIKHVIIVIQENRTPDNLFHDDQVLVDNGGNVRPPGDQGLCGTTPISLTSSRIDTCFDTRHRHTDWVASYNSGQMNGACNVVLNIPTGCTVPACNAPGVLYCPEYTYVPNSGPANLLTPYFQIANQYGFCNYCFQTNQGPSFPAHQFLFGATSLPNAYPNSKYTWFAAENVFRDKSNPNKKVGCIAPDSERVPLIDDSGYWPPTCTPGSQDSHCAYPCLDHRTLLNVIDTIIPRVTWRYYARSKADLWEAPAAVQNVCQPFAGDCQNPEYQTHVIFPSPADKSPILTNIKNCDPNFKFPSVSWVIPDGRWSDHAGSQNGAPSGHDGGPSFVAHIVNAVGNSTCTGDNHPNWSNTVILITWDDWGGFYDHVSPNQNAGGPGIGYNHGNAGSDKYVYGFRVPLLVVSGYTKTTTGVPGYTGYVSGPPSNPNCDGTTNYCHDFGSILNFSEYVFGIGGVPLGTIGDGFSNYADHFAPDAFPTCPSACPYSLSDFFDFNHSLRTFTTITGWKYPELCFHNPNTAQCFGSTSSDADPDNDALEE